MLIKLILRPIFFVVKFLLTLFIILTLFGAAYLWFFSDDLLKRLTPRIEAELGRSIDAKIEISDLKLSVYPRIGVSMNSVSLKPNNSCGAISAKHGALYMDTLGLIRGEYIIDYISLSGARGSLGEVNAKTILIGEPNCNPGAKESGVSAAVLAEASSSVSKQQSLEQSASSPILLKLNRLELEDLELSIEGSSPHKLIISDFSSAATLEKSTLVLSSPEVSASFDSVPISLIANSVQIDLEDQSFVLDRAKINVAEQLIELSAKAKSAQNFEVTKIVANQIDLPKVAAVLKLTPFAMPTIISGLLNISAAFNSTEQGGWKAVGDLQLTNLKMPGYKLAIAKLGLRKFEYVSSLNNSSTLKAQVLLSQFSILNGSDSYVAAKVDGPFEYKRAKNGAVLQGQLGVTAFGYRDGVTDLSNVSAQLLNIQGSLSNKGDLKLSTTLLGSSVRLIAPEVEVKSFKSVEAPLTVVVSSSGDYTVSGLVTAKEGIGALSGRALSDVSGSVRILISRALQEYELRPFLFKSVGRSLQSTGLFSINKKSFIFKTIETFITNGSDRGQLKIDGSIHRDSTRVFAYDISVNNTQIADIASLIKGVEDRPLEGVISSFKVSLGGSLNALLKSLTGQGSLQFVGSKIRGFSLGREIGRALSTIPFVDFKLSAESLPNDVTNKTAEAEFYILNQQINISKATINSAHYALKAGGSLSFEQQLDLKVALVFAQQTMRSLGGGFDKLASVFGKVGKIEIPLFVKGKLPDVAITPDLVTFMRNNSGINLVGDVFGTTYNAGRAVTDFVLRPFGIGKKSEGGQSQ